jgi:hypothetical protein
LYNRLSTPVILLCVWITILQSADPPIIDPLPAAVLDVIIEGLFGVELAMRFMVSPAKRKWFFNLFNIIDMMSIAPLIVRAIIGFKLPQEDARESVPMFILLCVVPFVRLLKALRRFREFFLLIDAFKNLIEALPVLLFTMAVISLGFSALIVGVEPQENIGSLGTAMWLTIVTMSTVGYGDTVPTHRSGYVTVATLVVTSVLYMAMPIGIVGYAFTQTWQDRHRILIIQNTRERMQQWGYDAYDIAVLFELFDTDQDGELNYPDFQRMLQEMGVGFEEEEAVKLFQSIDKDTSGEIDTAELVRVIFPEQLADILKRQDEFEAHSRRHTEHGQSERSGSLFIVDSTMMPPLSEERT